MCAWHSNLSVADNCDKLVRCGLDAVTSSISQNGRCGINCIVRFVWGGGIEAGVAGDAQSRMGTMSTENTDDAQLIMRSFFYVVLNY